MQPRPSRQTLASALRIALASSSTQPSIPRPTVLASTRPFALCPPRPTPPRRPTQLLQPPSLSLRRPQPPSTPRPSPSTMAAAPQKAPYGSWTSPITSDFIVSTAISFAATAVSKRFLVSRPAGGARLSAEPASSHPSWLTTLGLPLTPSVPQRVASDRGRKERHRPDACRQECAGQGRLWGRLRRPYVSSAASP